ncbi:MAG: ATP-binding protein, partial [Polyangiaceae bacterium]
MKGAVFDELFSWSERRPDWQRDALRRIVQGRSLNEGDIEQLVEICKRGHGLSIVELSANPLERAHIPTAGSEIAGPVVLTKLVHNANVNALAPAQTVEFAEHGLTIIFGNNAAGKSGYTRILKDACRARGAAETILTNVLAESMPSKLSAGIFYRSGGGAEERFNWTGDSAAPEPLSDVSVFDSQAAAVYVAEKTDVPFRPFGLDIFDKLAGACEAVRKAIDKERKAHSSAAVGLPELDAETAAGKLLGNLSALTPVAEVEALGTLSDAEEERLASLDAELARAKIEDPTVRARSLRRRATVLDELVSHGQALTGQLGKDAVDGLRKLHAEEAAATGTAQAGHGIASSQPLEGIGTASWRAMWGAAKAFSEQHAYPSVP